MVELEDLRDLGDRQEVIDDRKAGPGARGSTRLRSGRTERLDRNSCPHRSLGIVAARSGGGAISGLPSARGGPAESFRRGPGARHSGRATRELARFVGPVSILRVRAGACSSKELPDPWLEAWRSGRPKRAPRYKDAVCSIAPAQPQRSNLCKLWPRSSLSNARPLDEGGTSVHLAPEDVAPPSPRIRRDCLSA